jgi:hypothetical protein
MREGSVVLVLAELDERIRKSPEGEVYGTVIELYGDEVVVLLTDGNIFRGKKREVALQTDHQ